MSVKHHDRTLFDEISCQINDPWRPGNAYGTSEVRGTLYDIPEITPALEYAVEHPEDVYEMCLGYQRLLEQLLNITDDELNFIDMAEGMYHEGADPSSDPCNYTREFLGMLTDIGRQDLSTHLSRMLSPKGNELNAKAMQKFLSMLETGHAFWRVDRIPDPGAPMFKRTLLGHTQMDGIRHPASVMHFLFAQYIERYIHEVLISGMIELTPEGEKKLDEFVGEKDTIVHPLIETLLVSTYFPGREAAERSQYLYNYVIGTLWNLDVSKGGLGWLAEERRRSYEEASHLFAAAIDI